MSFIGHGPLQGFPVSPRSGNEIALVAERTRSSLGVTGPVFLPELVLESLSIFGVTLDVIEDADSELPKGVEACWIPDTVELLIRESVYLAACDREPRAMFTVAHELGHLALGHRRTFNRGAASCRVFEDSEWQANTFAAEFLMPLKLIRFHRVVTPEQMVRVFGVSQQAAETRIAKLRKSGAI